MPRDPYFEQFCVYKGAHFNIYLHEKGRHNLGRCYLALNRDGVTRRSELSAEEAAEEARLLLALERFFYTDERFRPQLINDAYLANQWPEYHRHVVPRYYVNVSEGSEPFRKEPRAIHFLGICFEDTNLTGQWVSSEPLPLEVMKQLCGIVQAELPKYLSL